MCGVTDDPESSFSLRLPAPSARARAEAEQRQSTLTKPTGSLGRLERIVLELAAWQDDPLPDVRPAAALLFAADHPVTRHGVSAYPSTVTRAMLHNFAQGGAAANVLARCQGIALSVVDVGVAPGPAPALRALGAPIELDPVRLRAAGDLRSEDAMDELTFPRAVAAGRSAVARQERHVRCLLLGEMGIGNSTAAAAVCAALIGGDPESFVGAGTGCGGEALARKRAVVREAVMRVGPNAGAREVLRRLGGREIAALYGAMLEALERRILVLVDGFIVTAAALVLLSEQPRARAGLVFAHRSDERAHGRVLEHLGVVPLLDLGMRLGEASGALMAFSLVEQACRLHREMATFASAGVPDRVDGAAT
jgi:nicotinate-nucleotide--dimethylbenzimidazole phosphoribosyltransferase